MSKLSGRMRGAMPSPVSQLSEARPGDTSPQPKRFGMRTVLPSGRREPSRRQCTNRGNQFVCYSGRETQASASAPRFRHDCENRRTLLLVILRGDICVSETKKSAPERTMPAAAQPIEIPFTLHSRRVRDCCGWPDRRPGVPKVGLDTAANPSVQALALISNDTCLVGVVDRSVQSARTPIPPEKEARGMNLALLNNNSLILYCGFNKHHDEV